MKIEEIINLPTTIGKNHESLLKAYHILDKVKQLLKRGDSAETIIELIEYIEIGHIDKDQIHPSELEDLP